MLKNKISHFQISCFLVSVMLIIVCVAFAYAAKGRIWRNEVILTANEIRMVEYTEIGTMTRDPESTVNGYYYCAMYIYYENGYRYSGCSQHFTTREEAEMLLGTTVEILIDGKGGSVFPYEKTFTPVPFILISAVSGLVALFLLTLMVLDGIKRHKGLSHIYDLFRKKDNRLR